MTKQELKEIREKHIIDLAKEFKHCYVLKFSGDKVIIGNAKTWERRAVNLDYKGDCWNNYILKKFNAIK